MVNRILDRQKDASYSTVERPELRVRVSEYATATPPRDGGTQWRHQFVTNSAACCLVNQSDRARTNLPGGLRARGGPVEDPVEAKTDDTM